jgi:hypothetical protein
VKGFCSFIGFPEALRRGKVACPAGHRAIHAAMRAFRGPDAGTFSRSALGS